MTGLVLQGHTCMQYTALEYFTTYYRCSGTGIYNIHNNKLIYIYIYIYIYNKASNTSLLYSFSVLFSLFSFMYSIINYKKKPCYVYCVKLTETRYSSCIALLLILIASIVLICELLWIKASSK